jgi:hypothetical protein
MTRCYKDPNWILFQNVDFCFSCDKLKNLIFAFTGCPVRVLVIALISLVDRDEAVQADSLAGEHLSGGINLKKESNISN